MSIEDEIRAYRRDRYLPDGTHAMLVALEALAAIEKRDV